MRFAAISDIHGNSAALRAVLADIDRKGIEKVVNLGDTLSGPMDPLGTLELLLPRDMPTVAGNHDTWLIDRPFEEMGPWEQWVYPDLSSEHLEWIRSLPMTLTIDDALLCHATPMSNEENFLDRRGKAQRLIMSDLPQVAEHIKGAENHGLILCGHTHVARAVRVNGSLIANPGAVGCPAYYDNRMDPPFIGETGAPDARYGIFEKVDDIWQSALCTVPYDPTEMIELTREKGAQFWDQALRTGWFSGGLESES